MTLTIGRRQLLVDVLADALGQHRLDSSVAVGALADKVIALMQPEQGVYLSAVEAREIAAELRSQAAISTRPGQLRVLTALAAQIDPEHHDLTNK